MYMYDPWTYIYRYELRGGDCWREWKARQRERKGRKKCDNCNSIINNIYLKNKKSSAWLKKPS